MTQRKVTYRLYPSKRQYEQLDRVLELHRDLYNAALAERIDAWKKRGLSVGYTDQCRELTEARSEYEDISSLNAQSQQVTLKRVDLAFKGFFRRLKNRSAKAGFPRFKSAKRFQGFGYKTHGDGWRLHSEQKHGRIRLSGVGMVKIRGKARTPGKPKTCEIIKRRGLWYASVTMDCSPKRKKGQKRSGLDWGLKRFATLVSEQGPVEKVGNPRYLSKDISKYRKLSKELSRKKRHSRNWYKAKKKLASCLERVQRRRHDFLHQESSRLVSNHQLIATEDLSIKGMSSKGGNYKKGLNRSILDTGAAKFFAMLKYKAEEAGLEYVDVPTRKVKPSQTCSSCGNRVKLTLADRTYRCKACGVTIDRDENAAKVMLDWALSNSGREPALCGAGVLAPAEKHETPSVVLAQVG